MPDERQQAVREIVAEWMRHARSDMTIARMARNYEIAPEINASYSQQAVEFPNTHSIGLLKKFTLECDLYQICLS